MGENMKETKRQRKKRVGMNAATQSAFKKGYRPPSYREFIQPNGLAAFKKTTLGVPFVNPTNFS
ncbi:MAG TPA: hypothetical protein DCW49_00565 [Alteromonas australica]|nr:hypothetical protein [Alteromonas australica]|tara:strand:- start:33324 stop:33515 length:192 start_codon:yes stop_codon:yes gene_type:complete